MSSSSSHHSLSFHDKEQDTFEQLFSQFEELDPSGRGGTRCLQKEGGLSTTSWFSATSLFHQYGLYLLLLIWIFLGVLALQPSYLFRLDESTQKYKFLYRRYFMVCGIVYGSCLTLLLTWKQYHPVI